MDEPRKDGELMIALSENLIWVVLKEASDRFSLTSTQARAVARAILEAADKLDRGGGIIIPRGKF